jgi:hypothetical protein
MNSSGPGHLDSTNSIEEKDKIIDITGLQNMARSLSAQHSGEFCSPWNVLVAIKIACRETDLALKFEEK